MAQIATPAGWNRLAALPRPLAALLLALLAGLMLLGTAEGRKTVNPNLSSPAIAKAEGMIGDHALYLKILRKMEAGTPYYPAVVEEHRAYPEALSALISREFRVVGRRIVFDGATGG